MTHSAYPKYKPSGIEWLGEIPEHWGCRKLKYIASVRFSNVDKKSEEGENPVRLCNYVDVYYNDHITSDLNLMEATASTAEIAKFNLREGDVLITKDSESWDDIAVPAYVSSDLDGVLCGYHLAQVRPNAGLVKSEYLFRSFCARGINDQFRVAATGITRYGLGKYWLDNSMFPVPPIDEQRAQIELLQEKRAALISHAVTKGLDPTVPMKPSGIEWLGEIPEHWGVARIKHLASIQRGKFSHRPRNDPRFYDGPYPFIQTGDIASAGKFIRTYQQTLNDEGLSVSKMFPKKTLVMSIAANIGDMAILGFDSCFPDSVVGFLSSPSVDLVFCYYALVALKTEMTNASTMNTQLNINVERIGSVKTALPPLKDQRTIASFLDDETEKLEALIKRIRQSIDKLREYRTALISVAVTGKIDVRSAESVAKPVRKANPYFKRAVLAAEIAHQLHGEPTFGRVKFQKLLYLCQHYAQLSDIESNYYRHAAGPHDNALMQSVERQLKKAGWFKSVARKSKGHETTESKGYEYVPLGKAGSHQEYFDRYWDTKREAIQKTINLLRTATTRQSEIVATLYAAWNDLILAGQAITNEAILSEVLDRWHEKKQNVPEDKWRKALTWMREKDLIPAGFGKPTRLKNGN